MCYQLFSNHFERASRLEAAKLLNERAERKSQYDALQEQLDTTSAALESNVQGLRRSAAQEAERYYKIDNDLISKEAILERTRDKEKSDAYIKSLEGSLKTQEDRNRKLKSTLRQLRDTPTDKRKMQAWANLLSIFETVGARLVHKIDSVWEDKNR